MLKVKTNSGKEFEVNFDKGSISKGSLNDTPFELDTLQVKNGELSIIHNHRSFVAEVLHADQETKDFSIRVNGNVYKVNVKDRYDILLKSLGIDNVTSKQVKELKAPMPGLVIDTMIKEGDELKKGDPMVVLEAMKMENILKSPTDGIVKKIHVEQGVPVEKNQLLISFE